MSVARAFTQRMNEKGIKRSRNSIFTVAADDHNIHCMTEDMIDEWWASLSPEQKAIHFEDDLNGDLYETVALANPNLSEFQAHVDRFFSDMQRIQKSPFTGLTREVAHGNAQSL